MGWRSHSTGFFFLSFSTLHPSEGGGGGGGGGGRGHGPKVVPLTITVHGCPGGRLFIAPVWTYLGAGGGRPRSISRLGSGARGHAAEIWVGRRRGWGRGGVEEWAGDGSIEFGG